MAPNNSFISIAAIGLLLSFFNADVESIGVCYGRLGNNLPPPNEVVSLYISNNIGGIRLYDYNQDVFQALKGTNITVIVDIPDPSAFSYDPSAAYSWVQNNIQAFQDVNFRYIAVGNELIPGSAAQNILPAMQNLHNALQSVGLHDVIKVSTSVSTGVFGNSYPPSKGSFSSDALVSLQPIINFLAANGAPLLVNAYPYYSYLGDTEHISLDYALFTSPGTVFFDGQLQYQNLFDAIIDAIYTALEKVGGHNVTVVVSESGWPSDGGVTVATQQNAQTYISNLIQHVGRGTPKRPGNYIDTYLFAMFDENLKQPQGTENHFGLFSPGKQPKYSLSF
ncbi:glucan endo-1,3-beta-glucosidase-like [Phalaenopsis equestris]|uniref:glucan endo-1,3-beta-glucosidase-like n=1 Tax=Phalaenopsis equestris TaxID=78828 RepID=UPI0009E448CE|nr:glucan endo-1,3-beta-glucosidase-like [Phalaenopsis equestris]